MLEKTLRKLWERSIGDKTGKYLVGWLFKAWEGKYDLYRKFEPIFEKRVDMIDQLLDVYPDLIVQGEDFEGNHTVQFLAREYPFMIQYAPIIHYKKLPNEIVIEIDNPSESELKKVLDRLKELDIEPLVCWSGNKSWHIHILTYPEDLTDKKKLIEYAKSEGVKEFTDALYDVILRKTEIEGLDVGVQKHSAHWIRSPYSLNIKTREVDGKIKKKIGVKKPINGDMYRTWFYGINIKLFVELELEIRRKKQQEKLKEPIKLKTDKSPKSYKWIENILNNPNKITDGRKRLIWLAIVPYLVLTGHNEAQVEEICRKWIEKSGAEWKSEYRCLARCVFRHCVEFRREHGHPWYPISLLNLLEKFPDLKSVLDKVVKGGIKDEVSGVSSVVAEN